VAAGTDAGDVAWSDRRAAARVLDLAAAIFEL
jgi:hypothetical protein